MKLNRFDKLNENREMYFVGDRKPSEEEQKFEIIEKLSQNWSEKLKQDYLVPRSLYRYSLDELKKIKDYYLNENNDDLSYRLDKLKDDPEFQQATSDAIDRNFPDLKKVDELDYDLILKGMKERGWGDIQGRIEDFENSEYTKPGMREEEYINTFDLWLSGIADGSINENFRIVEPKNTDMAVALYELKELHMSNEAVEDIRQEGNEIVFDVKCETDIQGTTEYNGFNLRYNKLCEIPANNYDEIDEHVIFEQVNNWKIKL